MDANKRLKRGFKVTSKDGPIDIESLDQLAELLDARLDFLLPRLLLSPDMLIILLRVDLGNNGYNVLERQSDTF